MCRCLPPSEPIDLINVAFQRSPDAINGETDYAVPDRVSGLEAVEELRQSSTGREWRFVEVNVPHKVGLPCKVEAKRLIRQECLEHRQKVVDLMYPSYTEMDLVSRGHVPKQYGKLREVTGVPSILCVQRSGDSSNLVGWTQDCIYCPTQSLSIRSGSRRVSVIPLDLYST